MGNFNRKAELASTAGTEELIWNKTGAYVFPATAQRMEVVSSDGKDVIGGVGARTVKVDYLTDTFIEKSEIVRLGDFATNKVAKGDMDTVTAGTEWKNYGVQTSLDVSSGAAVFTPEYQYDGIMQDINGATIPVTNGKKYFVRAKSSVASGSKQLAVRLLSSGGVKQVETATVIGTIGAAGAGNASVIVTAAGMTGSPKTILVAVANNDTAAQVAGKIRTALGSDSDVIALFTVGGATDKVILTRTINAANDATLNIATANGTCTGLTAAPTSANTTAGVATQGTKQVETATVVGTITQGGKAKVTVNNINNKGTPFEILVDVAGTKQVETGTVVCASGSLLTGGNASVIVTATGMTGSPKTVAVTVVGTKQVETATAVGTVSTSGFAWVTITSKWHAALRIDVPVVLNDDASAIALAIRTKLASLKVITDYYAVSGATDKVILTSNKAVANDSTLNIRIENGTCVGVTTAATSANTTAGVLADNTAQVATKIRAALVADADIGHPDTGFFTISGTGNDIVLTKNTIAANIANMNISIDNGTCTGITTAATSTNTVAGVAADDASAIAGKMRTALGLYSQITSYYDVGGATDKIILTSKQKLANDSTLNIATANYTCTGITAAATSANTTAGVAETYVSALTNFDVATADTDTVVSAIVTATGTSTSIAFAIVDTTTADFVAVTLDDIGMYELDTLGYQDKSLASLKLYFATYILTAETVKRTFNADLFRIQRASVLSAGTELDNAGNISVKELTGGSDYAYAYIAAGKMVSEQLVMTVPSGKYLCINSIIASALLAAGGKLSKIMVKSSYNRAGGVYHPALLYTTDFSFTLKDNTIEIPTELSYPEKTDLLVTTSGDATNAINVTLNADMY